MAFNEKEKTVEEVDFGGEKYLNGALEILKWRY